MTGPVERLAPVVRLAPAKINLTLAVGAPRPDGYHALHSVMVPLALFDRLSLAPLEAPPVGAAVADSLHVTGYDPGPADANLVLRGIAEARAAARPAWPGAPAVPPPIAARLEKRIPVSAGLAGGSSDGAAALVGALRAWGAELDPSAVADLAARLGSDVPFFLAGGPALVEGRGERVRPLAGVRGTVPGVLLVTPTVPVSTRDVFAAWDAGARPSAGGGGAATRLTSAHLADELASGALTADLLVARAGVLAVANDLAPATAVVEPRLPRFRRALARVLGRPVGLTGSGPTLWVLYPSGAAADAAAATVRDALADGRLEPPGGSAFVAPTTIVQPGGPEARSGDEPGDHRAASAGRTATGGER